jgi:hypothetical protein
MTRRQWLIVGSLALVTITLFVALIYVVLTAPSGTSVPAPVARPQKTYAAPVAALTARSAFALAQEAALNWKGDAYLTSASVSWSNATLDAFGEPVPWVFQFYSPSLGKVNVISVEGQEAKPLRQSYAPYRLSAVALEAWQVDSPQALAEWLNAGGGRFLGAHTLVDVHGALRQNKKSGRLVWYVTGLDSSGEDVFSQAVKAGP